MEPAAMRGFLYWRTFSDDDGWRTEATEGDDGAQVTTLLGPQVATSAPFTEIIPSWSAQTPASSWIEVRLRARRDERWTRFYRIAQWDDLRVGSARRSFDAQTDADGRVATDTLILAGPADMVQPCLLLHASNGALPTMDALQLALSAPSVYTARPHSFSPRELPVPPRSQMVYPDGGSVWCSPTALTMLLAYWHLRTADARLALFADAAAVPRDVVPHVYDPVYAGHGNWGFNTAFAASCGLDAYITRLDRLAQIEPWIAAGVPVVISVAWQPGGLRNAAVPSSNGHLLIVTGFDEHGQIITADPAGASEREVRRSYDAAELEAAWQGNSQGAVYLIHPHGWPTPSPDGAPWR
jgi:hypothetical protein